jgi:hypothetical protein
MGWLRQPSIAGRQRERRPRGPSAMDQFHEGSHRRPPRRAFCRRCTAAATNQCSDKERHHPPNRPSPSHPAVRLRGSRSKTTKTFRFAVSHISRKTSEMWGTQGWWKGQKQWLGHPSDSLCRLRRETQFRNRGGYSSEKPTRLYLPRTRIKCRYRFAWPTSRMICSFKASGEGHRRSSRRRR